MNSLPSFLMTWLSWLSMVAIASPTPSRHELFRAIRELAVREDISNSGNTIVDTPSVLRKQYTNPAEILSVLLIIGGDIVRKAVAQLSGSFLTPVSFSFGWIAYTFSALMSAFGDGVFMPDPDFPTKVITVGSRGIKINESWMVSRLVRDLEIEHLRKCRHRNELWKLESGLIVTVYQTQPDANRIADVESDETKPPKFNPDKVWWLSWGVFVVQPIVAAIPYWLHRNWDILLVTGVGMVLALATGSLPQYVQEKYHCRRNSVEDYIITRGNGHKHVFLLLHKKIGNTGISLAIEDLANTVVRASRRTRIAIATLALCWIYLLITIGGLSEDTWFLFLVGGIGMVHNVWAAGQTRTAEAHGIPLLQLSEPLGFKLRLDGPRPKVMKVLDDLEQLYPGAGVALLSEFFPGGLRQKEEPRWQIFRETAKHPDIRASRLKALGNLEEYAEKTLLNNQPNQPLVAEHRSLGLKRSPTL